VPQKLILTSNLCPGDILTLTAAVESLHATYPGEYLTDVRTSAREIWDHNPHITPIGDTDVDVRRIEMHYPAVSRCNQVSIPFLAGYTEYLGEQLGRPLRLTVNRPYLYLSSEELKWQDQISQHFAGGQRVPFWLLCAGTKNDYTAKQWPLEHYQEVIDLTRGRIQWVQIGGQEHDHPLLPGVIDLRGKTDHRQLIRLAYHATAGLGHITYLQHLMAAWEKPYIALVGGREPATWVQYPFQHTLHCVGILPCCRAKACWKSRTVKLNDNDKKDEVLCEWPTFGLAKPAPRCMATIRPAEVLHIIDRITGYRA
jgi:ADP-heptose:LPS heptosyltransferase